MAASKHIAHTLLLNAHPPETASAIFTEKVLHKPLHLRPTSPDLKSRDARAQRRLQRLRKKDKCQRRQKLKTLSAKEKRVSGIYDIPKNGQQYDTYVPLHRMWVGYMWEILGMNEGKAAYVTGQTTGSKLASADYHGAEITVVRSPCTGLVGLAGIVVRDTKFTFQIITKKNQLKSMIFLATDNMHSFAMLTQRVSCTQETHNLSLRDSTAGAERGECQTRWKEHARCRAEPVIETIGFRITRLTVRE